MKTTPILLVRQRHDAKRAGLHYDVRVVIGDKAHSWATKKEMPTPGKPILLFEQPVHDASYALSKRVEIPDGQYGAGVTTLDFAQKGEATIEANDAYHIDLNNGDRYLIKKLGPGKYGDKSWLFLKKKDLDKSAEYREFQSIAVSNGNSYDVNKLLDHTRSTKPSQSRISDLDWVLAHDTPDPKRIAVADISTPVIVTKEKGQWVVLDGLHRLAKAKSIGKDSIPSKVISPEDLRSLRMTNPYLEKIAADKAKKAKDSVGYGYKGAIAYASATTAGAASILPIQRLSKNLDKKFDGSGVTKADVESYQKAKKLRHVTRTGGAGMYASPTNHKIVHKFGQNPFGHDPSAKLGKTFGGKVFADSDGIAMHEYGHAHSYRSSGKAMRVAKFSGYAAGKLGNSPMGRLALAGAATSKDDKVSKGAVVASAALSVPMLHEEAKASLSPYKHLRKTRGAAVANKWGKVAGRAFGTYATTAAATVGGTLLARKLTQKARKNNEAKAAAKPGK